MASTSPEKSDDGAQTAESAARDDQGAQISPVELPSTDSTIPTVADLFYELRETNRLLREFVSQRTVQQSPSPTSRSSLSSAADAQFPAHTSRPQDSPQDHPQDRPQDCPQDCPQDRPQDRPPSMPGPDAAKEKTRQLVEDLVDAAFGAGTQEHRESFRENTILLMSQSWPDPDQKLSWNVAPFHVRVLVTPPYPPSVAFWNQGTIGDSAPPLTTQERDAVRRQWPVRFDIENLIQTSAEGPGWILGKVSGPNGVFCACPLVYGPHNRVFPASSMLDGLRVVKPELLASPGSLWFFTTPTWPGYNGLLSLGRLALIAAACLMDSAHDMGTEAAVREFLHDFCAGWKPLTLRGIYRSSRDWTSPSETSYQHTTRFFSPSVTQGPAPYRRSFVRCHRETGQFPALRSSSKVAASYFAERRMSVFCRWSYSDGAPCFTIVVLGDSYAVQHEAQISRDLLTNWEDRRFIVRDDNASFHLLLATVHRMLTFWEEEWSQCLDWLSRSVNTRLHDILSDETSAQLMFDSSYARSRAYFKTLEMLRIFGDTIRETGRDLQVLDPKRLLQGNSSLPVGPDIRSFLKDPAYDETLWENWRVLSEYQKEAEGRLLRKIAEKTEEVKSLRDGLFNATSLREASRSTNMNRYIIVFTIMTVLYLPLGYVAALFSTPLFDGQEQDTVVNQFKTSTIIACFLTWVFVFPLLWAADRWDSAEALSSQIGSLWSSAWAWVKRTVAAIGPKRSGSDKPVASDARDQNDADGSAGV